MRWLCVALFLLTACSSTSSPVASRSPQSSTATSSRVTYPGGSPSIGHYAVMLDGTGQIGLFDTLRVANAASVGFTPASFRPNKAMPFTSESSARLYYLSGGSDLGYLTADGHAAIFKSIPLDPNQELGFAVSPDDKRIAVSIFTYASTGDFPAYTGMRMYVEDLADGAHHVDIFTSSTLAEFPIGWVGGKLIVAMSTPRCCDGPVPNPYGANSYHVVDPATGGRLGSICTAASLPQGPIEPVGVMCGLETFVHWDGTPFPQPGPVPDPGDEHVALSPDGTAVLYGGSPIQVIRGTNEFALDESGFALGWVDTLHVVVATPDNAYWLVDARTGAGGQMVSATQYLGAFPQPIS